jgi:two-component system KDP operon response regulator KdpE
MTSNEAKRILVAEDEATVRDFVCRNLSVRRFQVLEATNGLEALALWETERPHMLILDVMMPRMSGLEVLRRVRERSTIPVIVLTALDAESDKVAAFELGADDYLTKPFGVVELMARVQAVLRRTNWSTVEPTTPGLRRYGDLEFDLEGRLVYLNGAKVPLSPTEFTLLEQLVSNPNKVLSHRTLLQKVWGAEYGEESEYLRVYMGRLRRKLEADPANPRHFLTEPGVGYRFVP